MNTGEPQKPASKEGKVQNNHNWADFKNKNKKNFTPNFRDSNF